MSLSLLPDDLLHPLAAQAGRPADVVERLPRIASEQDRQAELLARLRNSASCALDTLKVRPSHGPPHFGPESSGSFDSDLANGSLVGLTFTADRRIVWGS